MRTLTFSVVIALSVSNAVFAEGLVLSSNALSAQERQILMQEVDKAKEKSLTAFQSLDSLARQMPKLDARKRGRYAPVTQTLGLLGNDLLFPALEMLALKAPLVELSPSAALSLKISLVEATGELRDARAVAVWKAILRSAQPQSQLYRAAAEALGRLGTEEAAAELILHSKGINEKSKAVLSGMGSCRRMEVARRLAQALEVQGQEAYTLAVIKGVSGVGNSWAWKLEKDRGSETLVRNLAAQALIQRFLNDRNAVVRQAASNAIMVIDAPATPQYLQTAHDRADEATRQALKALSKRFDENPVR